MKALAIVDIHKSEKALEVTNRYIEQYKPDLLIICGDITTFGPLEFAEKFIKELPKITTYALPGNCDPKEVLQIISKSQAKSLHCRVEKFEDINFVGLGGSNSTPFNTPFELDEQKIYKILDNIMVPGEILVLHFPVKGHLDLVVRGEHTGSESALKIVEKYKPALVLSGHIHETRGIEADENGVLFVNPGPMKDGYAAIINIERGKDKRYDIDIQLLP